MGIDKPADYEGGVNREDQERAAEQLRQRVKDIATEEGFGPFIDLPTGRTMIFKNNNIVGPNFQVETYTGKLKIVGPGLSHQDFQRLKDRLLREYPDAPTVNF